MAAQCNVLSRQTRDRDIHLQLCDTLPLYTLFTCSEALRVPTTDIPFLYFAAPMTTSFRINVNIQHLQLAHHFLSILRLLYCLFCGPQPRLFFILSTAVSHTFMLHPPTLESLYHHFLTSPHKHRTFD